MVGVNLPVNSGAAMFQSVLTAAAAQFGTLAPSVGDFPVGQGQLVSKAKLAHAVVEFEALRASLPNRAEVAQWITDYTQKKIHYEEEDGVKIPLNEYMGVEVLPLPTQARKLGLRYSQVCRIPYSGKDLHGEEVAALVEEFLNHHKISPNAAQALRWIAEEKDLDLTGKKFAIMGAGAEVAPTEVLLKGGATVLWIDVTPPERFISEAAIRAGTLVVPEKGSDLIRQPREIAATLQNFSEGDPIHIGAFAYVGGKAMEWRLTAAMNAIIRSLPSEMVKSVSLYLSPTSPAEIQPADVECATQKLSRPVLLEALLHQVGFLQPNLHVERGSRWARSIVRRQEFSYLGAQFFEKRLAAEAFALNGIHPETRRRPVTVSANVAGISRTRSMDSLVFKLGFAGAPSLGLETYAPRTTRWLSGLMMIHDLLNPDAPGAAEKIYEDDSQKASALFSQQVHGGIYSYPYAIEGAITLAGLIGLFKKPSILFGGV